ncbi:glycosyltransferase family 4 protein [Patescibacteria group bacterium]|nr:glycosyltransferase family 4 protein [Patescibacteria group bacterium]MBU1868563.1 glycosyltransferase family 4 protein [Patescibacteria group bacterium]
MAKFRVLFVTRKYPPQKGGMENMMYGLISNYPGEKEVIALGRKQIHLLWFYPFAFLAAIWIVWQKKIDLIHIGDGVMAPLGFMLKVVTRKPVTMTAHGLDINFNYPLYKSVMPFFFRQMDHVVCVSNATKEECIKIGIDRSKTTVIYNGIDSQRWQREITKKKAKEKLGRELGIDLKNKKVLLSVGRLAERKGVRWFIGNVMPKLPEDYILIVIGGDSEVKGLGDLFLQVFTERALIQQIIVLHGLERQVKLVGRVSEEKLKVAYCASDVFVMPNIKVAGDMEGFGIVVLEANGAGLPVVGSRVGGLIDSIGANTNNILVEPKNSNSYVEAIRRIIQKQPDPQKVSEETFSAFSWVIIAGKYQKTFQSFAGLHVSVST